MRGFPTPDHFESVAKAYAKFVCVDEVTHSQLGTVVPLAWLIDQIENKCEWFPAPVRARKMYGKYFLPMDRMEAPADLEEAS